MSVIKFLRDITGLFNWNTDDNPTSEQTYMNAVKNWQETEKNLVDTILWQPTTSYSVGNMVKTPSLPSQYCLVCTTAGTSGANEPSYSGKTIGSSVSDGSVTWVVSGYLPVTGGTISGSLIIEAAPSSDENGEIKVSNTASGLTLYGYPAVYGTDGAFLALFKYKNNDNGHFNLGANNKILSGNPNGSLTWNGQPIQTSSDKRLKTDFSDVPADVLDAWGKVEWKQFKYIADKERKGDSCRFHTGLVAQDVCEVCGNEILKYGILCHDVREATEEQEAVDLWTVRYEEALAMEAIYLRYKIADLESRLQAVENRG